ncbi:hypothetical protein VP01_437g1 [Puccinia sorghi]|uniref:Uncharacterized protein n=1 Tax=Puccinia sorghi TaxID=27349 RepID=A0A0L6URP9_9BASI|nr:hypothetical protein VP01_437g1 [Puccinia sorghi]
MLRTRTQAARIRGLFRRIIQRADLHTTQVARRLATAAAATTTRGEKAAQWMQELERKQPPLGLPASATTQGRTQNNSRQETLDDQIIIYDAQISDDFSGSPNRIGLSMIGLLLTSGLVANQLRHHGAGPVWPDAQSGWLDFELELWNPSTRILVSVGLITFSFVKSLKFLFTLTQLSISSIWTPTKKKKRITIKKQDLSQLQQLIATSSKRKKAVQMRPVRLTFSPVGALELVRPVRKLFGFSVLESVPLSDMVRLSSPIGAQKLPHHRRSVWLKFLDPSPNQSIHSSVTTTLHYNQLNSFALQIPAVGRWGNSLFNLPPSHILSLLLSLPYFSFSSAISSFPYIMTLTPTTILPY